MHRRVNSKLRIRESWECSNPHCGIRVRISDTHLLEIVVSLLNRLIENDALLAPKPPKSDLPNRANAISQEVMGRLQQGQVEDSYIIQRAKEYARLLYEDSDAGTALAVTLARKRASMMQPQTEFRPDYFMELIDHVTLGLGGAVRLITKTEAEIGVEDHDGNEDR